MHNPNKLNKSGYCFLSRCKIEAFSFALLAISSVSDNGKVSLPGLSCHDVTDRVFPYDLGFTVYLRRCHGRYGGKCIDDAEKPFRAVFFVFNSLWIYERKSHCVIMFSFLNMFQNTTAYMIFLQYKQLCR